MEERGGGRKKEEKKKVDTTIVLELKGEPSTPFSPNLIILPTGPTSPKVATTIIAQPNHGTHEGARRLCGYLSRDAPYSETEKIIINPGIWQNLLPNILFCQPTTCFSADFMMAENTGFPKRSGCFFDDLPNDILYLVLSHVSFKRCRCRCNANLTDCSA